MYVFYFCYQSHREEKGTGLKTFAVPYPLTISLLLQSEAAWMGH
jgi:hypothetical protein